MRYLRREVYEFPHLEALDQAVRSLEPDGKGVPVLLRQYLKLGSRVLGFNVDPAFGDSIDVLLRCDLRHAESRVLGKYMGRDAAEDFLARHGVGAEVPGRLGMPRDVAR